MIYGNLVSVSIPPPNVAWSQGEIRTGLYGAWHDQGCMGAWNEYGATAPSDVETVLEVVHALDYAGKQGEIVHEQFYSTPLYGTFRKGTGDPAEDPWDPAWNRLQITYPIEGIAGECIEVEGRIGCGETGPGYQPPPVKWRIY